MNKNIRPYIVQCVESIALFLICCLAVYVGLKFDVFTQRKVVFSITLFFIAACIYIFLNYISRSLFVLIDVVSKKYITVETSIIQIYGQKETFFMKKNDIKWEPFFKVIIKEEKMLELSGIPKIDLNKKYHITYGKLSRVIVSIVDEKGNECIM